MIDPFGRNLNYLRISVTDLCNLRCHYCMPEDVEKCRHADVLSYEEIARLTRILAGEGIEIVRLTGGEPLVRPHLEALVRLLREIPGIRHVTLTTNGVLLKEQLPALKAAGLSSVNISLDSMCTEHFEKITGRDELSHVLAGISAAVESGIPTKINVVPQLGYNEEELADLAALAKDMPLQVRFIEMMPIGRGKAQEGLTTEQVQEALRARWPEMTPDPRRYGAGPAVYYRIPGFAGSIGFISAVHGKFCSECNRLRLTSRGELRLCLASEAGADLKVPLRAGASDGELLEIIRRAVALKPKEHHFLEDEVEATRGMYQIGG